MLINLIAKIFPISFNCLPLLLHVKFKKSYIKYTVADPSDPSLLYLLLLQVQYYNYITNYLFIVVMCMHINIYIYIYTLKYTVKERIQYEQVIKQSFY